MNVSERLDKRLVETNRGLTNMETTMQGVEPTGETFADKVETLKRLRSALIERLDYYKSENAKMDQQLKALHLLPHQLDPQAQIALNKLQTIQEKCDSKHCSVEAMGLSYAERLHKQNNYVAKVKSCIKVYNNFIERLTKEIKVAKGEFERSQNKIANLNILSADELKALEIKIERYEKVLLNFEKKYPWMGDPQYNLINISKETDRLNELRKEKEKLLQEFDVYQNLKPDISEAMKQLQSVKLEYNSL